jgi:hypothetical protein
MLDAKKSFGRSAITLIISLSTSKHREKQLLQTLEKMEKIH